jgi:hypothetical protein
VNRRSMQAALAAATLLGAALPAAAGEPARATARQGEDLARAAAVAWADDARLIYVENDEAVGDDGAAERWGYLFHSPSREASRAYSVKGEKIVTAIDAPFEFAAPPLPGPWIDSAAALASAEGKGRDYRRDHGGSVRAMFLVRGLLDTEHPDAPTWAVVYGSATASGLWVVVDARSGKVVKTWRG